MQPDELVLSDVHLRHTASDSPTAFAWHEAPIGSTAVLDADGDVCVKRRRRGGIIHLRHALETHLSNVGLQVWRGALLLADFLVDQRTELVEGATVLELGAGCGLCGVLAARLGAGCVYITDVGNTVLSNLAANVLANSLDCATTATRRFDWQDAWQPELWPVGALDDPFAWQASDENKLQRCTLIIVADCVYDDVATDALVARLVDLLAYLPLSAEALVAVERRVNFCIDSLSVRAPALDHFLAGAVREGLHATPLDCGSIHQAFEYERVGELELYRVTLAARKELT